MFFKSCFKKLFLSERIKNCFWVFYKNESVWPLFLKTGFIKKIKKNLFGQVIFKNNFYVSNIIWFIIYLFNEKKIFRKIHVLWRKIIFKDFRCWY